MSGKILYPLGKVKEIVEAAGMDISYAYEDLVFLEHNGFLLQFTGNADEVLVHRNIEAQGAELEQDLERLRSAAKTSGLEIVDTGSYRLTPVDDDNIQIEFLAQ